MAINSAGSGFSLNVRKRGLKGRMGRPLSIPTRTGFSLIGLLVAIGLLAALMLVSCVRLN